MKIKINNYIAESYVDGPGIRFTLFTQGCPHRCKGCHNPATHDFDKGKEIDIQTIVDEMVKNPLLDGITLSGGEPFCQIVPCLELVKLLKHTNPSYDIIAYTGYTMEQLLETAKKDNQLHELLSLIDYIVDGPFILELRDLELDFMGSRNQRIIDSKQSLLLNKAVETNF